jgi:hypothetical protein
MNKAFSYLNQHRIALFAFLVYCLLWLPLDTIVFIEKVPYPPIIIGEFPLVVVLMVPYSLFMLLNALFRQHHKLFYLVMVIMIYMPFFIASLHNN